MPLKMSELRTSVKRDVQRHRAEAMRCPAIARDGMRVLSRLVPAINKAKLFPSVYAGVSGRVYVNMHVSVKSFKEPLLVNLLERMLDKFEDAEVSSRDYAEMGLREYRFTCESISVEVNAKLEGEGTPLCRRVKVGEEVQVIEKFKFVCD